MTIDEVKEKKAKTESQIWKLLADFHGETGVMITGISIRTEKVRACEGEVITAIKIQTEI